MSVKGWKMNSQKQPPQFKPDSKNALFIELAKPNKSGFSRVVSVKEFIGKYQRLIFTNGADWARTDGTLAKYYKVIRHKRGKGNKTTHVELRGYAEVSKQKPIPTGIRREITAKRCVVLDTGKPECDHKNGRPDDEPRLSNVRLVTMDDFQPLSKHANDAKRQHCKNCRNTGIRFDATRLGYSVSQVIGGKEYVDTCVGCYWHDPFFFNSEVSRNYSDS